MEYELSNEKKREILLKAAALIADRETMWDCIAIETAFGGEYGKDFSNLFATYKDFYADNYVIKYWNKLGKTFEEREYFRKARIDMLTKFADSFVD